MEISCSLGCVRVEHADKKILFDPSKKAVEVGDVDAIFLSHSHRDHINRASELPAMFMSTATHSLLEKREKHRINSSFLIEPGEIKTWNGLKIEAFPAGHCLGSLQFRITFPDGERLVYTGDFCLERRLILEPGCVLQSDHLIIDTTYGSPKYNFQKRDRIYGEISVWIQNSISGNGKVLLGARDNGTAQELISLLNLIKIETNILVHPAIYSTSRIFQRFLDIGQFTFAKHPLTIENGVLIAPLWFVGRAGEQQRFLVEREFGSAIALCSGWAQDWGGTCFPLSSHGDFRQVSKYIQGSGARSVCFPWGFPVEIPVEAEINMGQVIELT